MSPSVEVKIGSLPLPGLLMSPENPAGLVIFAHGSGSSRLSKRNLLAADFLRGLGFATLLFDLLTEAEASDRRNVFDIALLGARVVEAIDWAGADPRTCSLPVGLFGASTGAGAAVVAGADRPDEVSAIVSRGGRPDLAGEDLARVRAPTLLVVGGDDREVLALNEAARARLTCESSLVIVPGAGHLFEEDDTLEEALSAAGQWYTEHLRASPPFFVDRETAGKRVAALIARRAPVRPVVYALPRGGVPIGLEIARRLEAPLDLLLVRKIGVPGNEELAAGAVVDGERPDFIRNEDIVRAFAMGEADIEARVQAQLREIERRRALYMPGKAPVPARGRAAILADDGMATGASMRAAIAAIRRRDPGRIIVAVPVASRSAMLSLYGLVDEVACLAVPEEFRGVGAFYQDFHQLTDREVINLLAGYSPRPAGVKVHQTK